MCEDKEWDEKKKKKKKRAKHLLQGDHSKKDLRYTQKPILFLQNNSWSYLLWSPVIADARGRSNVGEIRNCTGRWRIDEPLEVKEKQEEFREEMAENAEQVSELLEIMGSTKNEMERANTGAI